MGTDAYRRVVEIKNKTMAKRSSLEITKYVKRLSEAGVMKRPTWLEALERYDAGDSPWYW